MKELASLLVEVLSLPRGAFLCETWSVPSICLSVHSVIARERGYSSQYQATTHPGESNSIFRLLSK